MRLSVDIHYNRVTRDRFQHSGEAPPPVDRQLQLGEDPFADEPLEVRPLAQYPVEARRRNFQRVMTLDRILALEQFAHHVAHARAVVDRDACRRTAAKLLDSPINEYPYNSAPPFPRILDIDQLIVQRLDRRLQQAHQGVTHSRKPSLEKPSADETRKQKKGPSAPLFPKKRQNKKDPIGGLSKADLNATQSRSRAKSHVGPRPRGAIIGKADLGVNPERNNLPRPKPPGGSDLRQAPNAIGAASLRPRSSLNPKKCRYQRFGPRD